MNKKLTKYTQYLITAIATAVVVFVLCLAIELSLLFKCESYITKNELNTANLVQFATIEQLKKLLINEPENYMAMVKMANIYDELGKTQDANKFYVNALKASKRSNYTLFNYAIFCAKRNLYAVAASLAEEITGSNKKIIKYKAQIYETIAQSMYDKKDYNGAVNAYQITHKYVKNVDDKKYLKNIEENLANSYIKLADYYMEQNKIPEANTALNNSMKIKETPLAIYKLALTYIDTNKPLAQKYMERVFASEPYIVNPYIYNALLKDLIREAELRNSPASINYYSVKYDRFKKAMENIYLYKEDIIISGSYIDKVKDKHILVFNLKNNTKYKIDQLYLDIELFLNTKRYRVRKKVVHLAHTLGPYDELKEYKINLPSNIEFVDIADHNYLILKYFAKKSTKAPNTLVKIDALNF